MELYVPSSSDTDVNDVAGLRSWIESPDIFDGDMHSERDSEPSKDNTRKMDSKDVRRIRNCMNAFVNFTKKLQPHYKSEYPKEPFYGITRRIAHHWTTLTPSEKERYTSCSAEPIHSRPTTEVESRFESGHANITAEPGHGFPDVTSLLSSESSRGNNTAEPGHGFHDVTSLLSSESSRGNNTAEPGHGFLDVTSLLSSESSRGNNTAEPGHGFPDVTSLLSSESSRGNNTAEPGHGFAEVTSLQRAESMHASGENSSRVETPVMYGRVRSEHSLQPTIENQNYPSFDRLITPLSHVKLTRHEAQVGDSFELNATRPDVFNWAHEHILTPLTSSDYVNKCCRESAVIDGNSHPGTLSGNEGCTEARETSTDLTPVTSTTISVGWEYAGKFCTNVLAQVISKSSNSSKAKCLQLPIFDGNKNCTTDSAVGVTKHIEPKSNDGIDCLNSTATKKRKRKQTKQFSCNRQDVTKKKVHRRKKSSSESKNKNKRRKDGVMSKSKARDPPPSSKRYCSAHETTRSPMTGSILFSSGIKLKYRKILPKPSNITQTVPTYPTTNSVNQIPVNGIDNQSLHMKNEIKQENFILFPHEKTTTLENEHPSSMKQNRFGKVIQSLRPNDEICSSIKSYMWEPDVPKQSVQVQPTDHDNKVCKGDQDTPNTSCVTRCGGKQEVNNNEPICKTFALKEEKPAAVSKGKTKNYSILINRLTNWDVSLQKTKDSNDVRNKSPAPNLVAIFPLLPEVDRQQENDTTGSSDASQEDIDFPIEGCDSPMWFSSGSSGAISPPYGDNTDLTDRTLADCTEAADPLNPDFGSQSDVRNVSTIRPKGQGTLLQSDVRNMSTISQYGPRTPIQSDVRNISTITQYGPRTPIQSDVRNVSTITQYGPRTPIQSDVRTVSTISQYGPRTPLQSDVRNVSTITQYGPRTLLQSDARNMSTISQYGPGTPLQSDVRNVSTISQYGPGTSLQYHVRNMSTSRPNGPGKPLQSDVRNVSTISQYGPGTSLQSDVRNVSTISQNGPGTPLQSDARNVSAISQNGPGTHLQSDVRNVSTIRRNGQGTPLQADDIIAMQIFYQ